MKRIAFVILGLAFVQVTAGCAKLSGDRPDVSSGAMGKLVAGDDVAAAQNPTTTSVRIIDEAGKKVLQYLDPAQATPTWIDFAAIEIIKSGTQFYHWGDADNIKTWSTKGFKPNEIEQAVEKYNDHDVMGSGFYLSESPLDSADYGAKLLVVEPKHDVVVLNVNGVSQMWQSKQEAIEDYTHHVLIPMTMISGAGIEAVHYTSTWLVTLKTELLANVFEGSWANFLSHPITGGTQLDFVTFAGKYDFDPALAVRPDFQASYPAIAHYIEGQTLSPADLATITDPIVASFQPNSSGSSTIGAGLKSLKKNPKLSGLYMLIEPLLIPQIQKIIAGILEKNDTNSLTGFFYALDSSSLSISQILPDLQTFVNPSFINWFGNLDPHSPLYVANMSDLANSISQNMPFVNFYVMLDRLDSGSTTPWYDPADKTTVGLKSPYDRLQAKFNVGGTPDPDVLVDFTKYATFWSATAAYRDTFMTSSGPELLDGQAQPGYVKVNAAELKELQADAYITLRVKTQKNAKTGVTESLVQYDYPSAANYLQYIDRLKTPGLADQLKKADAEKALQNKTGAVFKSLTQKIVQDLARQAITNTPVQVGQAWVYRSQASVYLDLLRLQLFADLNFNRLVMRSYLATHGNNYISDSFDLEEKISELELEEFTIQSSYAAATSQLSLAGSDSKQFHVESAYGLWAYAAACPGPHKDTKTLVATIKATFEKPDVRALVQQQKYSQLRQALHASVVEQCQ